MRLRARHSLVSLLAAAGIGLLVSAIPVGTFAAPSGKTFQIPEEAVDAFVEAFRKNDTKVLHSIFGKGSEPLFQSADPVADDNNRTDFLERFDDRHELTASATGSMVLTVGADAWPLPIPLVKTKMGWAFDTAAGFDEMLNRRIGRNELQTIQTCLAFVDAQHEYYSVDRDGDGILEYAQSFRSTAGQHDGLYWAVKDGEEPSPLGEFAAAAAAEGYSAPLSAYHGYYYRMLAGQGPAAQGGAYDYRAGSNQIGGFAVLAYPASYGDLGVMSFIVNHDGVVYQRDLGSQTAAKAAQITTFDPVAGWTRVADQDLAPIPDD